MDTWISVKERLPEISQQVLIFVSDEQEIHVAQFCDWEKEICNDWHVTAGAYTYDLLVFEQKRVTHWMSLPEPPNE